MKKLFLILLFSYTIVNAQNRLYFQSIQPSDVSGVTVQNTWGVIPAYEIHSLRIDRLSESVLNKILSIPNNSTSLTGVLFSIFVSPPLTEQTISGNVKLQAKIFSTSNVDSVTTLVSIYLIDGFTGALKNTILSNFEYKTTIATVNTNHIVIPSGTPITSVSAKNGDRIQVEFAIKRKFVTGAAYNATIQFTNSQSVDLPEDNTSLSPGNTWIEFSNKLLFNHGITQF